MWLVACGLWLETCDLDWRCYMYIYAPVGLLAYYLDFRWRRYKRGPVVRPCQAAPVVEGSMESLILSQTVSGSQA